MQSKTVIGIDIGGTKIRVGRVSPNKKIVEGFSVPTEAKLGSVRVLQNVMDATKKLWRDDVSAIGVGIAGIVDSKKGVFVEGPNLPKGLKNTPVAALLRQCFKVPVTVDNDVHCFTLAEAKLGAAKRFSHVVGLTFGTGVGGGLVIDGKIYRGRNNAAGEFGHTVISLGGQEQCGCGKKGHFESYASGTAMSNLYFAFAKKRITPIEVERAAKAGDMKAKRVLAVMTDALAAGLANVIHGFNPDIIVIGGGLSDVKALWSAVDLKLRKLLVYSALRDTPIARATLGADANVLGAALLSEQQTSARPRNKK